MKHKNRLDTLTKVYSTIIKHRAKNGYSPSVREIADELGGISTAEVHKWVVELEASGGIKRVKGVARGIVPTAGWVVTEAR